MVLRYKKMCHRSLRILLMSFAVYAECHFNGTYRADYRHDDANARYARLTQEAGADDDDIAWRFDDITLIFMERRRDAHFA